MLNRYFRFLLLFVALFSQTFVKAQTVIEEPNILMPSTAGATETLASGTNTIYRASSSIVLRPNFTVQSGATFQAIIGTATTPTITFPEITAKTYGDPTFTLSATASNGAAITYTSDKPELASVSGNTVTIKAPGTVTITASTANPAASATRTFTINKKSQVITVPAVGNKNQGDPSFSLGATSNSELTAFTYIVTGPATVSTTGMVTPSTTGAGQVIIKISQAGNVFFLPAETTVKFEVKIVEEQISFATIPSKTFGDPTFNLTATSNKGSEIEYSSSALASISGNTVTILGAGTVTITAKSKTSAASASQTITIARKDQTISIAPVTEKNQGGDPFQLVVTANSGLKDFTYTASGPATVSSTGQVTPSATAGGMVIITVNQSGGTNYLPKEATVSFNVKAINPTITFEPLPVKTYGDAPFNLVAFSSSNATVKFGSDKANVATINGNIITITGAGVATITASTESPLASTTQILTVNKAPQKITITPVGIKRITDSPFQLQVFTNSPVKNFVFEKISGSSTVSSTGLVTPNPNISGEVVVKISHPGDANYLKKDTTFSFKIDGGMILTSMNPKTLINSPDTRLLLTLTPNAPQDVTVTFFYKKITEAKAVWDSTLLTSSGKVFEANVFNKLGEIGLSYYFRVVDGTNKKEFTDVAHTFVNYDKGLDLPAIPGGTKMENYQIIACPLQLSEVKVRDVLDELGGVDIKKWRLFHYDTDLDANKELTLADTIKPGKGYWLISRNLLNINTGEGTAVQVSQDSPFRIQLKKGYNQIGNPYNFAFSWEAVRQANNPADLKSTVYTFSPNGWKESTTIKAFEGAYVWADFDFEIRIPTIKPNASALNRSSVRQDSPGWDLELSLFDSEGYESKSAIGMMPGAIDGKDSYDQIALPRFMKYLEMNTNHPEYFASKFSKDIVSERVNHKWNFTVETNTKESNLGLSWDVTICKSKSEEFYLLDRNAGVAVNMKEKGNYSFPNSGSRDLTLYYGDKAYIENSLSSESTFINEPFPNPFSETTTISYALANSSEQYEVEVSIYNMVMEQVVILKKTTMKSGFYHGQWNGLDASNNRVSSGMYFVRMKVSSGGDHKEWLKKVILQ